MQIFPSLLPYTPRCHLPPNHASETLEKRGSLPPSQEERKGWMRCDARRHDKNGAHPAHPLTGPFSPATKNCLGLNLRRGHFARK